MPERKAMHHALEQSLRDMVATLPVTPQAVVMVSGHWEAAQVGVMSAANPPMEYDYYNFPPHTYEVTYPAPGNPALAESIVTMLASAGIAAVPDAGKGFDHGAFVPMHVMYPAADMPLVQVSMLQSYSPQAHVAMGRALAALREQGVLLVGSGLSYHNLRLMGPEAHTPSHAFDAWLHETLMLAPEARMQRVLHWEQARMHACATREKTIWCRCLWPWARPSQAKRSASTMRRACMAASRYPVIGLTSFTHHLGGLYVFNGNGR